MENPIKMDGFGGTTILGNIHINILQNFVHHVPQDTPAEAGCCNTELLVWEHALSAERIGRYMPMVQ